jgi:hypothetical protein
MTTRKDTDITRERDGRYGHGLDSVCKCGRTKGQHLAVRPWPQDDTTDGYPECEGFRKAGSK